MAKYYPVCLDLKGKRILVAGGGDVAERKVKTLLEAGAQVCVVSPALNNGLEKLKIRKSITYIRDEFKDNYLDDVFVVIGATDRPDINSVISREAQKRNILVNIADSPDDCNFIVPAVLERGDLIVSISTCGNSPALAKRIREELEQKYGVEYSSFLEVMGEMRNHIISRFPSADIRNKVFNRLVSRTDELLDIIKSCGENKARERIEEIVRYE